MVRNALAGSGSVTCDGGRLAFATPIYTGGGSLRKPAAALFGVTNGLPSPWTATTAVARLPVATRAGLPKAGVLTFLGDRLPPAQLELRAEDGGAAMVAGASLTRCSATSAALGRGPAPGAIAQLALNGLPSLLLCPGKRTAVVPILALTGRAREARLQIVGALVAPLPDVARITTAGDQVVRESVARLALPLAHGGR